MEVEFFHDLLTMGFHGLYADTDFKGYFLGAFTFGDKLQDLAFTVSKAGLN